MTTVTRDRLHDPLACLVAWTLPGATRAPLPPGDANLLLGRVAEQRVSGVVLDAAIDGALEKWPSDTVEQLRTLHLGALRTCVSVEAAAVETVSLLDQAGLTPVVLKGCATAHLDYPDPAQRIVVDVDLLLPDDQFIPAQTLLRATGHVRRIPPERPRWERQYGKAATFNRSDGIEVDLHRSLLEGYFGLLLDAHKLVRDTEVYEVAGQALRALDGPGRLLHAAFHTAGSGHFRISSARDVAQMILVSEIDWSECIRRAERFGVAALLAAGIRRAWEVLSLPDHPAAEWSRNRRPTPTERQALASLGHGGERLRLSGVLALPWWRWPSFLWPLALPTREHLKSRGRTYPEHMRITLRRLRSSR